MKYIVLVLLCSIAIPALAEERDFDQEIARSERLGIAISQYYNTCVLTNKANTTDCKKFYHDEIFNQARIPCTALSPVTSGIPSL